MPVIYQVKKNAPKSPVALYGEMFHHLPPPWVYRGSDPEEVEQLAREALQAGKPVPEWEPVEQDEHVKHIDL